MNFIKVLPIALPLAALKPTTLRNFDSRHVRITYSLAACGIETYESASVSLYAIEVLPIALPLAALKPINRKIKRSYSICITYSLAACGIEINRKAPLPIS